MVSKEGRSKKRSWRQGFKRKAKKFFKTQTRKDERQIGKEITRHVSQSE